MHRNKVHSKTIKVVCDKYTKKVIVESKFKKTQVQKTKAMKTRGAISLVTTAEGTEQKYTFSTRNIKVIIENSLTKQFVINF